MGKYSSSADVTIPKTEIAKLQLEDAIQLFLSGKYLSALTLAGAADGILSEYLKSKGLRSIAEETWDHIIAVREATGLAYAGTRTKKDALVEWNLHKNRTKHHNNDDEEFVTMNCFDAAHEMIQRANLDGDKLGVVADNRQEYENWLVVNVYM